MSFSLCLSSETSPVSSSPGSFRFSSLCWDSRGRPGPGHLCLGVGWFLLPCGSSSADPEGSGLHEVGGIQVCDPQTSTCLAGAGAAAWPGAGASPGPPPRRAWDCLSELHKGLRRCCSSSTCSYSTPGGMGGTGTPLCPVCRGRT